MQLLKKHTLNPEITLLFYQFHAQKALFKVSKICNINFWIENDPPLPRPHLEPFQKFMRFGSVTLPLGPLRWCNVVWREWGCWRCMGWEAPILYSGADTSGRWRGGEDWGPDETKIWKMWTLRLRNTSSLIQTFNCHCLTTYWWSAICNNFAFPC